MRKILPNNNSHNNGIFGIFVFLCSGEIDDVNELAVMRCVEDVHKVVCSKNIKKIIFYVINKSYRNVLKYC